jgi:hypothetical protein
MGRSAVAAPLVGPGKAAQVGERDDFAKLPVEFVQRPHCLFEHREELPLDVVENRRKVEHAALRSSSRGDVPENTAENYATVGVLKERQEMEKDAKRIPRQPGHAQTRAHHRHQNDAPRPPKFLRRRRHRQCAAKYPRRFGHRQFFHIALKER